MALSLRHLVAGACAVALLSSTAGGALAQGRPSIDARTWRPSTDPNASLVIEPAITPGPGVLTLGRPDPSRHCRIAEERHRVFAVALADGLADQPWGLQG